MNIQETKLRLEQYYDIKDISAKGRQIEQIDAKRYCIWYCRNAGFKAMHISVKLGLNIHTVNHHKRYVNDMINIEDKKTLSDIYSIFKLDLSKDPMIKRVKYIHKEFTPLLQDLTYSQLINVKERLRSYIISL